ncbi:heat shock 70 kDa protein 4 [Parasteatoda tepidariorum]|uniref:heat shock 70 kDa protein 4 n=1 Tax=Parasteatoda tepidariorum TaxID=114398 RepID=UPI00077FB586|nr:heat shock 70 kDa protein 4 [Parasteatoda tepidariorum]
MSVIGFDIGNENSYVAVARAGGIETIANEYSQRSTPTYVAFGNQNRQLGVSAKNQQITNLQNTIYNFKRLLGRLYSDQVIKNELQYVPYDTCALSNNQTGIQVNYLKEKTVFSVPQIMGMMLTKLKEISETNLKIKIQDCVISVPVYFTDWERRMLLDSAQIAGLNALRLLNETTAVALAYGFYLTDLTDDKARNVVFVDFGQSSLQASACAITKGKLKVLGASWKRDLGGRDFDNVIVRHFVEEFKKKYKLDVMSNKRAVMRLMQESEKLKKQMSANSLELPLNIECFMNDIDVTGRMKREDFEKLAEDLFKHIETTLLKLLEDTKLKPEDIDSVQIVGGSSRIPAFKNLIVKVFGKEPSTSLNQDEAVARGCALQCAMLSPTFKVRDFSITDIQPYDIQITFPDQHTSEICQLDIFPYGHQVPYSKLLTYYRKEPFLIEGTYKDKDIPICGTNKLSTFKIKNVVPSPTGESAKLKIKARVNLHGIFSICSATMLEKQPANGNSEETPQQVEKLANGEQKDEVMESENTTAPNGDINNEVNKEETDKPQTEKKEPEQKKPKSVTKAVDLPIEFDSVSLSRRELDELIEREGIMMMQDKMEKERADAKNAVEEYVYEFRDKLYGVLEKFVTEQGKEQLCRILEDTENWLYDEGEDQQKSVYVQKLTDLKNHGDPIVFRFTEFNNREAAFNALGSSLQRAYKALQLFKNKDPLYDHITVEEMNKVQSILEKKQEWHGKTLQRLSSLLPYENPPVTVNEILQQKEELENVVNPILSKPKPKVEPPPEEKPIDKPQADSEMPDSTNDTPEATKPDDTTQNQPQCEKMETN